MGLHALFDDDITDSDSGIYAIQEAPERETPGQWVSPSPTFHTSNWRSTIGPNQDEGEDRQPQLITKHWFGHNRYVDLPDGHITLANLTGRSYSEAFKDLGCFDRPRESPRRRLSIASDDSHSPDSPGINAPKNFIKDLSLSPELVSVVAEASFQDSEAAVALPLHSIEIDSTSKSSQSLDISASVLRPSASPDVFQKDVAECVELTVASSASETSMQRSGAPPSCNSQSPSSRRAVQKPTASTTPPPLRQSAYVARSDTEEDDLIGSADTIADDAYSPEPEPPSGSRTRRAKKPAKSSNARVPCPECRKYFTRKFDMLRHKASVHRTNTAFTCTCCEAILSRKDSFKRHVKEIPRSCIKFAKQRRKLPPAQLSEETYARRKIAMLEACTRQPFHRSGA